jgi:hypothetical protein
LMGTIQLAEDLTLQEVVKGPRYSRREAPASHALLTVERQVAVGQGVFRLPCWIPILRSPSVWRGFFDVVDHKNLNRPFVRQ